MHSVLPTCLLGAKLQHDIILRTESPLEFTLLWRPEATASSRALGVQLYSIKPIWVDECHNPSCKEPRLRITYDFVCVQQGYQPLLLHFQAEKPSVSSPQIESTLELAKLLHALHRRGPEPLSS